MFARFFVDRPIFATVLSIVIVIIGLVALQKLPIAQYPEVVPPTVNISATYPAGRAPGLALKFFSVSCAKSGRSSCGMSSSCTRVGMPMER